MDGPQVKQQYTDANMNELSVKDLLILKMFLEKGTREKLFLASEEFSVNIIRLKLKNLIHAVMEKQQLLEKQNVKKDM